MLQFAKLSLSVDIVVNVCHNNHFSFQILLLWAAGCRPSFYCTLCAAVLIKLITVSCFCSSLMLYHSAPNAISQASVIMSSIFSKLVISSAFSKFVIFIHPFVFSGCGSFLFSDYIIPHTLRKVNRFWKSFCANSYFCILAQTQLENMCIFFIVIMIDIKSSKTAHFRAIKVR